MRKRLVAGNWKMNTSLAEGYELVHDIKKMVVESDIEKTDILFIPPLVHLKMLSNSITGAAMFIGAQNCHQEVSGAYTGEVSARMLASIPVQYVLVGHSERRQYFGESNILCNAKIKTALESGLNVIYCFGETLEERESGHFLDVLKTQVREGLEGLSENDMNSVTLAYEPVWAIGTGKTASSGQAQEVHKVIRELIQEWYGEHVSAQVRILYGGSVKPNNAEELFSQSDIDGGLIGGASLKADDFMEIIRA
jgi:triosephosphate isomerase